jgi:hypothetical protein
VENKLRHHTKARPKRKGFILKSDKKNHEATILAIFHCTSRRSA